MRQPIAHAIMSAASVEKDAIDDENCVGEDSDYIVKKQMDTAVNSIACTAFMCRQANSNPDTRCMVEGQKPQACEAMISLHATHLSQTS